MDNETAHTPAAPYLAAFGVGGTRQDLLKTRERHTHQKIAQGGAQRLPVSPSRNPNTLCMLSPSALYVVARLCAPPYIEKHMSETRATRAPPSASAGSSNLRRAAVRPMTTRMSVLTRRVFSRSRTGKRHYLQGFGDFLSVVIAGKHTHTRSSPTCVDCTHASGNRALQASAASLSFLPALALPCLPVLG